MKKLHSNSHGYNICYFVDNCLNVWLNKDIYIYIYQKNLSVYIFNGTLYISHIYIYILNFLSMLCMSSNPADQAFVPVAQYILEFNSIVCSGSVVVTAYDPESGTRVQILEWGLIYYKTLNNCTGLTRALIPPGRVSLGRATDT